MKRETRANVRKTETGYLQASKLGCILTLTVKTADYTFCYTEDSLDFDTATLEIYYLTF